MLEQSEAWPKIKEALGERSIKEVADEFGVTSGAITLALVRTNTKRDPVGSAGAPPPPPRKEKTGRKTESVEVNGLHVRKGTSDEKIAPFAERLGVDTDANIAEDAGVSPRTVATFRRRNGIKGKRGRRPSKKKAASKTKSELPPEKGTDKKSGKKSGKKKLRSRGKPSKLDPFRHLLGTMPDADVAEKAGVSANAAAAYRRRRDIPSYRANKRAGKLDDETTSETPTSETPTSEAAAPSRASSKSRASTTPSGTLVFAVTLKDGSTAYVLADDLVDAASKAQSRKGVTGVSLAGPLL